MGVVALTACSDDNGDGTGKDIQLAPDTPKNYTIYADETSGTPSEGISFTTTGPWRATVAETRTDSWVTVLPDHGDAAGDYTISISLGVNTSGQDRKATVTIECGGTKITITVEQKGTTEEGEIPDDSDEPVKPEPTGGKLVSRVHYYFQNSPDVEDSLFELTYDEQNRLVEWKETLHELVTEGQIETVYSTTTYTYENNIVRIVNKEENDRFTVYLNKAGYAERAERTRGDGMKAVTYYKYNGENQLIRTEQEDEWEDYVWEDGNLVKSIYGSPDDADTNTTVFTYKSVPNLETPDVISAYNELPSWYEELAWAGLLGVRNRNLILTVRGDSEWSYKDDFDMVYELYPDGSGYIKTAVEYGVTSAGEQDTSNPRIAEFEHIERK